MHLQPASNVFSRVRVALQKRTQSVLVTCEVVGHNATCTVLELPGDTVHIAIPLAVSRHLGQWRVSC